MGHKVNPKGFRTGPLYTWDSKWFARDFKAFASNLRRDLLVKKFLAKELKAAGVSRIEVERTIKSITFVVHSAKPGVIIGRSGAGVEDLKKKVKAKFFGAEKTNINLNIVEVDKPATNSQLVMQGICIDIEKRLPFRRVMKQVIDKVQKGGAQGIKISVSGRLNGAEIARTETLSWGKIPLHTLRANIDYARGVARTMYGAIGVKVWVYKGEVFNEKSNKKELK